MKNLFQHLFLFIGGVIPFLATPTSISAAEDIVKVAEVEGITEYRLANGTRVLLFPDPSKNVVTVNMTVFVGSRHEGYGEAGMAHLLEHMLFKGTATHPDIPKALQDRGANFNGTTWVDRTNYYETLPASEESLQFAIRMEADRLVNSPILPEHLSSEMTVVRNEFERGENDPFGILLQRMTAAAYDWHNYGRTTIGNRSDIERVPVQKLRQFYRKFYRPDNVMLVIAGKFDVDRALELARESFGSLPVPEEPIDATYTLEPAQDGERTVVLRRVGNTQLVGALYHIPAGSHPDFAAMRIVSNILGDEPSGRLYKNLVQSGAASTIAAFARPYHDPGVLMAVAQVSEQGATEKGSPEQGSLEQARQLLIATVEQGFKDQPITEQEVQRARQQILKARELEASSTDRIAVSLSDWAAQGDWRLYFIFRDVIESITVAQVQEAADRYLVRNNRTVGLYIPSETSERISIPEAPDLNNVLADYKGRAAIAEGEAFDPTPANIEQRTQRGTLVDGIKYAFLPKRTRGESVSLMLTLRYGNPEALAGKTTISDFLAQLLGRGTEKLDFQALQDEWTRLRANVSISDQPGVLQVRVKTTRQNLAEVLSLLGDVLRHPRLDGEELEILRRQAISGIEETLNDPQTLAALTTRRTLSPYPSTDVRYIPTLQEELAEVKAVKLEQIVSFYHDFMSSQAGELAVVGDFDAGLVREKMVEALGGWKTEIPYVRIDRPAVTDVPGGISTVRTPDKANAVYFASQQYPISDLNPDYPNLVLGNFILGGGSLSSRLGVRVRQQEGLSYGVASMLSAGGKDERCEMMVFAIANPENKDRLLQTIEEEIRNYSSHGMTEDELGRAKEGFLQQEAVARTDDARLATMLVGNLFLGRTMDFYAAQEQQISKATLAEVNSAISKYLNMDRLVITVAGDFQAEKPADKASQPSAKK